MIMRIIHALKAQSAKYSRQGIVPDFLETQKKLIKTNILIIGIGGLGCPVSLYLYKMGGKLTLLDFDKIEIHNLPRQVLFNETHLNKYKSEVAAKLLGNGDSSINFLTEKLSLENSYLIENWDIIVDCTDSIDCRYLLNDVCKKYKKKYICASVLGWEGQVYCYKPDGACYKCMYPTRKTNVSNCDEAGVIATLCGIIGSLTANEVIKAIGDEEYESFIYFDGKSNELIKSRIRPKNKQCSVCFPKTIIEKNIEAVSPMNEVCYISWKEVEKLCDKKKVIVIDVRSAALFNYLRLENSINLPLSKLGKLSKDEVMEIIKVEFPNIEIENIIIAVLCKKGISAQKGVRALNKLGLKSKVIRGGLQKYTEIDHNFEFF